MTVSRRLPALSTPTTAEGIEKYLTFDMIKGIGPIYAKKLVKAFREQALLGLAASLLRFAAAFLRPEP